MSDFTIEQTIPQQLVEDLLDCAWEGGSNYWACADGGSSMAFKPEGVVISDDEDGKTYSDEGVWVQHTNDRAIYDEQSTLARFLLLLANHRAARSSTTGLLVDGVPAEDNDMLRGDRWDDERLQTIRVEQRHCSASLSAQHWNIRSRRPDQTFAKYRHGHRTWRIRRLRS